MSIYDFFLFNLSFATIPAIIIAATLANSAPEIFIPDVYGTKNRHQKLESIYGIRFWGLCQGYYITESMLCTVSSHSVKTLHGIDLLAFTGIVLL